MALTRREFASSLLAFIPAGLLAKFGFGAKPEQRIDWEGHNGFELYESPTSEQPNTRVAVHVISPPQGLAGWEDQTYFFERESEIPDWLRDSPAARITRLS